MGNPFWIGYEAWNTGASLDDNPYDVKDRKDSHDAWAEGWAEAAAELGEDES